MIGATSFGGCICLARATSSPVHRPRCNQPPWIANKNTIHLHLRCCCCCNPGFRRPCHCRPASSQHPTKSCRLALAAGRRLLSQTRQVVRHSKQYRHSGRCSRVLGAGGAAHQRRQPPFQQHRKDQGGRGLRDRLNSVDGVEQRCGRQLRQHGGRHIPWRHICCHHHRQLAAEEQGRGIRGRPTRG